MIGYEINGEEHMLHMIGCEHVTIDRQTQAYLLGLRVQQAI